MPMAFFKKLKERLFKSSSKIEEGLDAIVEDGGEADVEEVVVDGVSAAQAEADTAVEAQRIADEEAAAAQVALAAKEARLAEEAEVAEQARLAQEAKAAEEARAAQEVLKAAQAAEAAAAEEAEAARLAEVARLEAEAEAQREADAAAAQAERERIEAEAQAAQAEADRLAAEAAAADAEKAEAARLAQIKAAEVAAAAQAAKDAADRQAAEAAAAEEERLSEAARLAEERAAAEAARREEEIREAAAVAAAEDARLAAEAQAAAELKAQQERDAAEEARLDEENRVAAAARVEAEKAAEAARAALEETVEAAPQEQKTGLLGRLFGRKEQKTVVRRALDDAMLESIEDLLITADMGVDTALRVSANLAEGRMSKKLSTAELKGLLAAEVTRIMEPVAKPMPLYQKRPQVVLVVGVNGSGKTTTIGKLASQFKAAGKSVVIAAGDTFRAAAVEQLQVWGDRAGVPVLTAPEGSDPASLAFDAMTKAEADGADLLLIDTAGRLQNRQDLMEELAKIVRVIRKKDPDAPHNTLLVLDATTGQNALSQVEVFRDISDVSGLVMTKLDGTAKGGVLVALADKFGLPIHAIGVGEQIDDLAPFDPEDFANALTGAE